MYCYFRPVQYKIRLVKCRIFLKSVIDKLQLAGSMHCCEENRGMKNWRARLVKAKQDGQVQMCPWNILITECVLVHRASTGCKNKMVIHSYSFLLCCFFYWRDFLISFVGFAQFVVTIQCFFQDIWVTVLYLQTFINLLSTFMIKFPRTSST